MKFFVNISSIIIMLLSFSSITSAQNQQRPSQRSFATVLSKIKEKKSGRDRVQKERQQPELKNEKVKPTEPTAHNSVEVKKDLLPAPQEPDPAHLPSRQNLQPPPKPKSH